MTLYYEDDPADETTVPQLPPLLRAVEVPAGQDVWPRPLRLLQIPKLALFSTLKESTECRLPFG